MINLFSLCFFFVLLFVGNFAGGSKIVSNVEIIKLIRLLSENNEIKTNDLFIQFYGCNEATINM